VIVSTGFQVDILACSTLEANSALILKFEYEIQKDNWHQCKLKTKYTFSTTNIAVDFYPTCCILHKKVFNDTFITESTRLALKLDEVPFAVHPDHTVPWTGTSFQQILNVCQMLNQYKKGVKASDSEQTLKPFIQCQLWMLLFLPDLALFVKELSSTGNLLAKVREVDVSASSHARERFNKISPSSLPH